MFDIFKNYKQIELSIEDELSIISLIKDENSFFDFSKENVNIKAFELPYFNNYICIELYGTDNVFDPEVDFALIDIVTANDDFNDHYVDSDAPAIEDPERCIGRQNGDYFTYNPETKKYQVRSHECFTDVWDEYGTFQAEHGRYDPFI
jgi:hypothetical protein